MNSTTSCGAQQSIEHQLASDCNTFPIIHIVAYTVQYLSSTFRHLRVGRIRRIAICRNRNRSFAHLPSTMKFQSFIGASLSASCRRGHGETPKGSCAAPTTRGAPKSSSITASLMFLKKAVLNFSAASIDSAWHSRCFLPACT